MSALVWGVKESLLRYVSRTPDGRVDLVDGVVRHGDVFAFPGSAPRGAGLHFRGAVVLTGHGGLMRVVLRDPGLLPVAGGWVLEITDPDDPRERLPFAEVAGFDGRNGSGVTLTGDGADLFFGPYEAGTPLDAFTVRG
ncbi:HtaA domain-containing protein [Kineococcus sp. SYSU DK018]|uniref:HtaA domain-containing protein n=1 Tax=Kineococcus sp. SYSU DK018 TaxID=3383139 RepID=UPI003D7D9E53